MPTEISPESLRTFYYEATSDPLQLIYKVPAGEMFVLTAWTLTNPAGQAVTARLRRNSTPVAFSRIWEAAHAHNHLTFPTGIPFAANDEVVLETSFNSGQHYFFGYVHIV